MMPKAMGNRTHPHSSDSANSNAMHPHSQNHNKGSANEEKAASFFLSEKYEILSRNYRKKSGEIDIIAWDPTGYLVFVEVKYRASKKNGYPEEAVNRKKQERIYRTAAWYLKENHLPSETRCRFDVIAITDHEIRHIKNAFGGFA